MFDWTRREHVVTNILEDFFAPAERSDEIDEPQALSGLPVLRCEAYRSGEQSFIGFLVNESPACIGQRGLFFHVKLVEVRKMEARTRE